MTHASKQSFVTIEELTLSLRMFPEKSFLAKEKAFKEAFEKLFQKRQEVEVILRIPGEEQTFTITAKCLADMLTITPDVLESSIFGVNFRAISSRLSATRKQPKDSKYV